MFVVFISVGGGHNDDVAKHTTRWCQTNLGTRSPARLTLLGLVPLLLLLLLLLLALSNVDVMVIVVDAVEL